MIPSRERVTEPSDGSEEEDQNGEGCLAIITSHPKPLPPARISLDIGSPPFIWLKTVMMLPVFVRHGKPQEHVRVVIGRFTNHLG